MDDRDQRVRLAAFAFLERLQQTHGGTLPYAPLLAGFDFEARRVPLLAPQGTFKPAVLDLPLSITTTPHMSDYAR
jgi:putative restriction endonuclease